MSWQEYVDNNLVGTKKINKAAILGVQGGVWAHSAGFDITREEQTAVVHAFNDLDKTRETGVRLANEKFFTLQAEGRSIYAKKGANGAILVKTTQAILVAEYEAPTQAGEATVIVEGLADYLIGVGY